MSKRPEHRISRELRAEVFATYGYRCHLCGGIIEPDQLSIDHVVPSSRGGLTTLENLRPAHRRCNQLKDNLTVDTDRRVARSLKAWAERKGRRRR